MNRRGDGRTQRRSERNTRQTRGRKRLPDESESVNVSSSQPSPKSSAPPTTTQQQKSPEQTADSETSVPNTPVKHVSCYFVFITVSISALFCSTSTYIIDSTSIMCYCLFSGCIVGFPVVRF